MIESIFDENTISQLKNKVDSTKDF